MFLYKQAIECKEAECLFTFASNNLQSNFSVISNTYFYDFPSFFLSPLSSNIIIMEILHEIEKRWMNESSFSFSSYNSKNYSEMTSPNERRKRILKQLWT